MHKNCLFAFIGLLLVVCYVNCYNPFFPPIKEPLKGASGRSTPAGVIDQLYWSYESKQLSLYRDLFSTKKTFRFYVTPKFYAANDNTKGNVYVEQIDTTFDFAYKNSPSQQAYYWNYDDEIQRASNLFTKADGINFKPRPPKIDSTQIEYFTDKNGIEYAQIKVQGGVIEITIKTIYEYSLESYNIDMGLQVYYLTRDPNNLTLWVIEKWFDFGTASN